MVNETALPTRAYRILREAGVERLEQLTDWTAADLLALSGFGQTSLAAVEAELARQNLALKTVPRETESPLLSVGEAARRLGLNDTRVRLLIRQGRIPATRIGARAWAIREADLERFSRRRAPRQPPRQPLRE